MKINLVKNTITVLVITALIVPAVWIYAGDVLATGNYDLPKKWTICHHTGSESNPFVKVTDSVKSVGGHFDNDGKPLHEGDYILDGDNHDCPKPTPKPTPTPKPSESPKPTPKHTHKPSPTPTPSPVSDSTSVSCAACGGTVINITNNNNNHNENKNENKVENNNTSNSTSTANTKVSVPSKLPETGVGAAALVSMFGTLPLGAIMAKFRKGQMVREGEGENLGGLANEIANLRSSLKQDA